MRTAILLVLASFAAALSQPQAAFAMAAAPLPPQTGNVAGSVSGRVLDPSGAPIAGAEVTLAIARGAPARRAETDEAGIFRFDRVPAGSYLLDIQFRGFREKRVSVHVGAKSFKPIRVVLALATEKQSVTVAGGSTPQVVPIVSENQNANVLNGSALDRVPVFDQDYIATLSRFLDQNAIGTAGVDLIVDGQEAPGAGVSASAIQEVKINQNPYSARFARPGRARMEIITKGGTTQFHGEANFMFRDSIFDARNAYALVKPAEQRRYYEGSLTGPVGSLKRTTFLLSLQRDDEDQQAVIVAQNLSGPIDETAPNPTRHVLTSLRVFHDLTNGDEFWTGYSYEGTSILGHNIGGNVLPEAATDYNHQEHDVYINYRHLFSPRLVSQTMFLIGRELEPTTSETNAPAIIVEGAFTGGGGQIDLRRTEVHTQGTQLFTYARGRHEVNFGFDVGDITRRGFDNYTGNLGTYTFSSLAAYAAGQPSTFTIQQGPPRLIVLQIELGGFVEDNMRLRPNLSVSLGVRYYFQNYFHDVPDNFAPRLGFAWAPTRTSKTVFRGGAGVFFDRSGPLPITNVLYYNGVRIRRYILNNPPYPVTPADLVGAPTSLVELDPSLRIPFIVQFSFGVERQITAKSSFSATYIGTQGFDLFRSIDANAPLPPNFGPRPNPAFGQEQEMQSAGYQQGNALELLFRGTPSKYFSGQVQYTLSRTYNNTSGINFFPANSYDPAAEWGRSDTDRRQDLELLGSTEVSHYFTLGTSLSVYSGYPVNITTGADNNGDGVVNDRPPGVRRNSMQGPGYLDLDFSLSHNFPLSRSKTSDPTLTVFLQSFNVLNHRNDQTYVGVITSPFFGHSVSAYPPRRMQINLQFKF